MDLKNRLTDAISLIWPLAFVPITLLAVNSLGHSAGNAILGLLFFYVFAIKADAPTRRLMVALAVMGMIFETANVASGAYNYTGTIVAPMWISLGWGILGWWTVHIQPRVAKISTKLLYALTALSMAAAAVATNTLSLSLPIAIAGLYIVLLSSKRPFGVYAFTAAFAIIAEYSGTAWGAWQYFESTGSGVAVSPDLASLALSYAIVMAFCGWISGFEPAPASAA